MKRVKILYIIFIVASLFWNVFLLSNISKGRTKSDQPETGILKVNHKIEMAALMDEMAKVDTNCILSNLNSEKISLSNILRKRGPILILNISKLNCNTCVDKDIDILKSYLGKEEKNTMVRKVVILFRNSNMRDLLLLRKSIDSKIDIYQVEDQPKFELNIEALNVPFFFVLDRDFYHRMIHVVNKEFPEFTIDYLNIIFSNRLTNSITMNQ